MEQLKEKSAILLSQHTLDFQRYLLKKINWQNRLICILGSRGAGKTTLLLQRIKMMEVHPDECLYITLDDMYFSTHTLVETAERFRQLGGKYLFIDEVHKYTGWAREVKNIYDFYKDLHLVVTGSSIIELLGLEVDLSRRARQYDLNGMSFREYLEYEEGIVLDPVPLEALLTNHVSIAAGMNVRKPVKLFKKYLEHGYYPFYKEDKEGYFIQLSRVVNLIVEYDLAFLKGIDKLQIRKIYQLLGILSTQVPFKPNMTNLAKTLEMSRGTLIQYFHYLERAKLIQQVYLEGKGMGVIEKPSKVLLDNPNLFEAMSSSPANTGSRRECFFVNQFRNAGHAISLAKAGDFIVDQKYTFEVGGADKTFKQIASIADSYVAADDLEIGSGNKIPLWLFGLMY